jgi:hypothetical protein
VDESGRLLQAKIDETALLLEAKDRALAAEREKWNVERHTMELQLADKVNQERLKKAEQERLEKAEQERLEKAEQERLKKAEVVPLPSATLLPFPSTIPWNGTRTEFMSLLQTYSFLP